MTTPRAYATELLNYENSGVLEVSSLTLNGSSLTPTTPGTVDASKIVIVDSNSDVSGFRNLGATGTSTLTTVAATTATVSGAFQQSFAAITAGTTQTQAGATAITTDIVQVTTGVASDGVRLPALTSGMIGRTIRVINASSNAGVIYGTGTTNTNTINGTAGATGVAYAASKMLTCVAVSATAWVTTLSN